MAASSSVRDPSHPRVMARSSRERLLELLRFMWRRPLPSQGVVQTGLRSLRAMRLMGQVGAHIWDPSVEHGNRIEETLAILATYEDMENFVRSARASPSIALCLEERWDPPRRPLEELARMPEGSLGHAYARHMRTYGLDADYYPSIPSHYDGGDVEADFWYLRRRLYECHDIWHAVLDYGADLAGEMQIVGFYLGHFSRHWLEDGGYALAYPTLLCADTLLHAVVFAPWELRGFYTRLHDGYRTGEGAKPFFSVQWENMWERPVEELRTELDVRL